MKIKTSSPADPINFPFKQYNNSSYEVDWGDGAKETNSSYHRFVGNTGDIYTVTLTGEVIYGLHNIGGLLSVESIGLCPVRKWIHTSGAFQYCTDLTSVSGDLFNNIDTSLEECYNLYYFFAYCTNLTTVSNEVFKSVPNNDTAYFNSTFYNCTSLTKLPDLWVTHPNTKHSSTFDGCTQASNYSEAVTAGWITQSSSSSPSSTTNGIVLGVEFNQNDNKTVNLSTFIDRNEYIPDVIIDWGDGSEKLKVNEHDKSYALSHTYTDGLTYDIVIMGETTSSTMKVIGIPDTTYNHNENDVRHYLKSINTSTSGYRFRTTPISIVNGTAFCKCPKLESIVTSYIFYKCTEQTNFRYCFAECYKLQSIPENLFQYCTKVQNFEHTFENCGLTSIPANLFKNCTEVTNFEKCFNGNTNVTGSLPALWSTHSKATSHADCFTGCTQATNWNDALSNGWATGTPSPSSSSSFSPSSAVNYAFPRARTVKTASDS